MGELTRQELRWALGLVDLGGFERSRPLFAAVDGTWPSGARRPVFKRIEGGDHDAALGIELGMRARSYVDDVWQPTAAMRRAWAADRIMTAQVTEEVGW